MTTKTKTSKVIRKADLPNALFKGCPDAWNSWNTKGPKKGELTVEEFKEALVEADKKMPATCGLLELLLVQRNADDLPKGTLISCT